MLDRRSPLFGAPAGTSQGQADYDPEAMEKENDKSVSDIGDRVNLLKNITKGIQDEVHTQHGMLDGMGLDMAGARGMLGGTVDKLGKVMENASNKKIMYTVGAIVVGFLFLYFWLR